MIGDVNVAINSLSLLFKSSLSQSSRFTLADNAGWLSNWLAATPTQAYAERGDGHLKGVRFICPSSSERHSNNIDYINYTFTV